MDYELAKALAEAGYPQGGKGKWVWPPDKLVTSSSDRVYVPTLGELIEACGDTLIGLHRHLNSHLWTITTTRDNPDLNGYTTMDEAVARHVLALYCIPATFPAAPRSGFSLHIIEH